MTAQFNQDFITFVGDDVFPIFTVQDSSGAAIDISTVTQITWYCQQTDAGGALATRTKTAGQITFVTDGTDGKFQVDIPAAITATLEGIYQHIASITDASGYITTVTVGQMRVGPKPNWTYNPAKIADVPLFQVRRWLGDIIADDQQMPDSEILFAISQRSTILGAAADCARQLAAQYARKIDVTSPGSIQTAYGEQSKKYALLGKELDSMARARGAGITPYAGGISRMDKQNIQENTDRVQPAFNIGMTDNTLPVGQVGNETPQIPSSGSQA